MQPPRFTKMANRGNVQRGRPASAPAPPTHDDNDDDYADSDDQWEDGGVEDWDEPENAPTRCLFTDQEFASPAECLAHAASSHALDLNLLIGRLKLDLYDKMKLVNFLRTSLRAPGADVAAVVAAVVACQPGAPEPWPWSEDTYLQPVLADDPLLYSLSMDDEEADEAEEQACTCTTCTCTCTCTCTTCMHMHHMHMHMHHMHMHMHHMHMHMHHMHMHMHMHHMHMHMHIHMHHMHMHMRMHMLRSRRTRSSTSPNLTLTCH
jgi:hypothetical protein